MRPESKPEKSEWMQIAESDNASSNVRKVDKRLTLGTLASVGAIVIAGSLFANASDEPNAVADITPAISQMPTGGGDDEDEDDDHEGRDRGGDHDDDEDEDDEDDD